MKRLALAATLALAFLASGCDDDGDGGKVDGGDAGADVKPLDAVGATCVGTFTGLSRAQLGSATSASGACRAASDLDYICVSDLATTARNCGTTCLMISPGADQAALVQCVDSCLNSSRMLTAGCAVCYRNLLTCTVAMCNAECTSDPNSNACRSCQVTRGCMGAFFTCSGLPGGTPSDGGVDSRPDSADALPDAGADTRDAPIETGGGDAADARIDGGADAGVDASDAADATAG
ncbi:MAG TPA: hypothetical protein VGG33_01770 [Polyangia bacterium]